MIWHNIKQSTIGWALKLAWSNAGLAFFGFLIPIAIFGDPIDIRAEIMTAGKTDFDMLVALGQGNHDTLFKLGFSPFVAKPFVFILGRYGLMLLLPALVVLIVITLVTRIALVVSVFAAWLQPRLSASVQGWARRLIWLAFALAFFGFVIPIWLKGERADFGAEALGASKASFAMLSALGHGDVDTAGSLIVALFNTKPSVFVVGRCGLFLLPLALAIVLVISFINWIGRAGAPAIGGAISRVAARFEHPRIASLRLRR